MSSRRRRLLAVAVLLFSSGCDVEWGGAEIALINPAPVPEPSEAEAADAAETVVPLPEGDLLYLVRLTGEDGGAESVPIARMVDGAPASLGLPENLDAAYRARFDSAFYAPGTELPLHAGGHRVGTLVLDGHAEGASPACPSTGRGRALLLPDTEVPEFAFAWAGEGAAGSPITYDLAATDNRMRTFGPVLAENLFRRGGENRPYLAQRAAMRAVPWPGDERPAMTATYFVNDELGGEVPANAASSLFFLARFDGRAYVPEWWEVRRYGDGRQREAFVYFGAIAGPDGRVDFVTRHDERGERLAASVDDEEREIDWTEAEPCPAVAQLRGSGSAAPAGADATGPAAAPGG